MDIGVHRCRSYCLSVCGVRLSWIGIPPWIISDVRYDVRIPHRMTRREPDLRIQGPQCATCALRSHPVRGVPTRIPRAQRKRHRARFVYKLEMRKVKGSSKNIPTEARVRGLSVESCSPTPTPPQRWKAQQEERAREPHEGFLVFPWGFQQNFSQQGVP